MKFIHFSDLHIGVENYGRIDPETGMSTRLLDFLHAYDQMVEYAITNRVDAVLFAGDAYKSRDPSQTHQREFASRVARLSLEGIPVLLVTGNHDLPSIIGRASALEIFPTLVVENVVVSDHIETNIIHTRNGPLQVVSLPWVRRSSFLSKEDTRELNLDEISDLITERLASLVNAELEKLDTALPAVLVGHVTVMGAKVGTERSMMLGRDHTLLPSALRHPNLDYVALGHIHKHQIIGHDPMVVYSGSMQRVDFSEETEAKGFCVVELSLQREDGSRMVNFEFHPVDARPFLTIDVEVRATDEDPNVPVLAAISNKYIAGSTVRLRITVPEGLETGLKEAVLRDALKEAHYIAGITKEVVRPQRTRLAPEVSKGFSTRDALKFYLSDRNFSKSRADILLTEADNLINEELEDSE